MSSFDVPMGKQNYIIHPYKFNMWLFILTLIMIFGGLTSAYIVSTSFIKPENRLILELPSILVNNSLVIVFSSITMQFAVWMVKRGEATKAMLGLMFTFVLGAVFLVGQVYAWQVLTESGLPMVDPERVDNSASFFYIFTGLHGAHIVGGLVVLLVALFKTSMDNFKSTESRSMTFEITATFWHFLGLLWIYLYVFLWYTQHNP